MGAALTTEALERDLLWAGRNDGPAVLFDAYFSGRVSRDVLRDVLVSVWSAAEFPEGYVGRSIWIRWFRRAAYDAPSEPLVLYRGATPRHARRMAWTTDRDRAAWFAARWAGGHVYEVVAPPAAILADVDAIESNGRGESEIIVDPSLLPRLRRAV